MTYVEMDDWGRRTVNTHCNMQCWTYGRSLKNSMKAYHHLRFSLVDPSLNITRKFENMAQIYQNTVISTLANNAVMFLTFALWTVFFRNSTHELITWIFLNCDYFCLSPTWYSVCWKTDQKCNERVNSSYYPLYVLKSPKLVTWK